MKKILNNFNIDYDAPKIIFVILVLLLLSYNLNIIAEHYIFGIISYVTVIVMLYISSVYEIKFKKNLKLPQALVLLLLIIQLRFR